MQILGGGRLGAIAGVSHLLTGVAGVEAGSGIEPLYEDLQSSA
jgi:hypothetical protein